MIDCRLEEMMAEHLAACYKCVGLLSLALEPPNFCENPQWKVMGIRFALKRDVGLQVPLAEIRLQLEQP